MGNSDLTLDKQVCFALYSASRAVTQLYRPVLDSLGLTYPQYLVLIVLWERGPTTVKDLGTALRLDSGTLSPLLKRLESAGLVARERRAEDERSVRVRLTDKGDELRGRACVVPGRIAGASGMDLAELEELRQRLVELTEAVGKHTLAPLD
ncbi:MarR family transcriptional regulator [Herbihabitans rhizosphaerae]|uniref:MarR family transcriptional regulator n=1 Tax=Herbihabitans rhizosphaerae TaxID=1872711 RepID=A0A4Q7KCH4_9PSEU|nr:MarR family transcriptional regulator [Herbihabitans rhizosphaerae]RZS31188.1 MarR family transcriptional regulator [Herbihabitans rhizosphaerae]